MKQDKAKRLVGLTSFLLDRNELVTLDEIHAEVYDRDQYPHIDDAFTKCFERDKDDLRDAGINIEAVYIDEGVVGYTIRTKQYFLPKIPLTPEERVSLAMALRFLMGMDNSFSELARSALLKLEFDEYVEEGIATVACYDPPSEGKNLTVIVEGLTRCKDIQFEYHTPERDVAVKRVVSPYGVYRRDGAYYMVGHCHLRNEVRRFKIDRIVSGVKILRPFAKEPDFEVPDGFDIQADAGEKWLKTKDPQDVPAKVKFEPHRSLDFANKFANVESTEKQEDESLIVTYRVKKMDEFVGWLLKFGTSVKVISPENLVDALLERVGGK